MRKKGGKGKIGASLLRIDKNDVELSKSVIDAAKTEMKIFCAFDDEVISTKDHNLINLSSCTQEGDTRGFLHIGDMAQNGEQKNKITNC